MLEKADSKDIIVTSIQYPETSPATLHIAAILAACGVIPQVSQVSKCEQHKRGYVTTKLGMLSITRGGEGFDE